MKKIFVAIMALGALASCSKDETVALNQQAIQFGNAFVDNSTRATDPSYSANDIASFKVYGTIEGNNIFDGVTIQKNTADYGDAWTQVGGQTQYWVDGADYVFVGIVDGDNENVTATTTDTTTGLPTSISYKADGATDLLCQTVEMTAGANENRLVAFSFTHLLSKVNFTIKNLSTDAEKYSFVVKNINFAGNVEGVYNVATPAWSSTDFVKGNTAIGNGNDKEIVVATGVTSNELGTEVLFLPGSYDISFTVEILYDGNVITSTDYPATGTYSYTLKQNHAYNFNVEVSVGNQIKFTVSEQPTWADGNTTPTDNPTYVPVN